MYFDYCKICGDNTMKRTDDLAIMECITAIFSIIIIENHLFKVHLLIYDTSIMTKN